MVNLSHPNISMQILSTLISLHFPSYWRGEFVIKWKALLEATIVFILMTFMFDSGLML